MLKIGQGKAMKNKWIAKEGAGFVRVVRSSQLPVAAMEADQQPGVIPEDTTATDLQTIRDTGNHPAGEAVTKDLQKRKLITPR